MAVGDRSGGPALAELWNGKSWAVLSLGSLPGAQVGALRSVSWRQRPRARRSARMPVPVPAAPWRSGGTVSGGLCRSRRRPWTCTGSPAPRLRRVPPSAWNGAATWSASPLGGTGQNGRRTPSRYPARPTDTELSGVSCPSRAACIAVGDYDRTGGNPGSAALAERWDGRRWSLLPAPSPGSADYRLAGVSCTTAAACMAVGTGGPSGLLAERWNGARWAIVPAPGRRRCRCRARARWPGSAAPRRPAAPRSARISRPLPPRGRHWPSTGTAPAGPGSRSPTRSSGGRAAS